MHRIKIDSSWGDFRSCGGDIQLNPTQLIEKIGGKRSPGSRPPGEELGGWNTFSVPRKIPESIIALHV